MKLELIESWIDDSNGDKYAEIGLTKYTSCCVKQTGDTKLTYLFECDDGNDIYSRLFGADWGLGKLNPEEYQRVIGFAKKEFERM